MGSSPIYAYEETETFLHDDFVPATLNEIKHNAQIEFSVVHWKEGNEKRRTFGRSNEAENVFRRA